jgi:hypothetical protein
MEKLVMILGLLSYILCAEELTLQEQQLEKNCLSCHKQQQIPSSLIYKRYLMKYSTHKSIEEAMFRYLKDPDKNTSIMPPQFFLKFPMKETLSLDDKSLLQNIRNYLNRYDIKQKLRLEK